jgi:predicted O-methyltransferase YrrM
MKLFEQFAPGHVDRIGAPIAGDLWRRQPRWAVASISDMHGAFLAGLVKQLRPRKVVEIGVASGWGSCVILAALEAAGVDDAELHGIDIAPRFFYDPAYETGQCVREVMPGWLGRYRLTTGVTAGECMHSIGGGIGFAFIDAHHMHPWATLDLLATMPFLDAGSWVALHDLNLSRKEDQQHRNRGPKYLFEGWDGDRLHSVQQPTMVGAIRMPEDAAGALPALLDILYTPWELPVESRASEAVCAIVDGSYGTQWAARFRRAIEIGNYHVSKVHSPDIDELRRQVASLEARPMGWARRLLRERNA